MEKGEAARVFISYRRQETAWPARQLYDVLVAALGADRVFKDVDNIEPGDDFGTLKRRFAVNYDVASKDYISELKKAGIIVIVWTVNEEQAWKKAKATGADKVLTDKPRAYEKWLAKQ